MDKDKNLEETFNSNQRLDKIAEDVKDVLLNPICGFNTFVVAMNKLKKYSKELEARGVTIDVTDDEGNTSLSLHAEHKGHFNTERFKILIAEGANAELPNKEGQTPLMKVVLNAERELFGILMVELDIGIDAQEVKTGKTVLMHAVESAASDENGLGSLYASFVETLVDAGADLKKKDNSENTACDLLKAMRDKTTTDIDLKDDNEYNNKDVSVSQAKARDEKTLSCIEKICPALIELVDPENQTAPTKKSEQLKL